MESERVAASPRLAALRAVRFARTPPHGCRASQKSAARRSGPACSSQTVMCKPGSYRAALAALAACACAVSSVQGEREAGRRAEAARLPAAAAAALSPTGYRLPCTQLQALRPSPPSLPPSTLDVSRLRCERWRWECRLGRSIQVARCPSGAARCLACSWPCPPPRSLTCHLAPRCPPLQSPCWRYPPPPEPLAPPPATRAGRRR